MIDKLEIRPGTAEDVAAFETAMPTGGTDAHAAHLADADRGDATWLVALLDGAPAGSCVLRWTGSVNPTTRAAMPEAIEINNLGVRPAYRHRGIGSLLIAACEHHARERARHVITLGVGIGNPDASRLYERLGYVRTGLRVTDRYTYAGEEIVEHSDVLVKTV